MKISRRFSPRRLVLKWQLTLLEDLSTKRRTTVCQSKFKLLKCYYLKTVGNGETEVLNRNL